MHEGMDSEEEPRAGMGTDEEKKLCQKEQVVEEDAGGECGLGQDQEGRRPPVDDWLPEENPALRMRWGPSSECSELRLLQKKVRIANEILTFLAEAALENVQAGLGQATSQELFFGEFKDDSETPAQPFDLGQAIRQSKGNTNCCLGRVAHAGRFLGSAEPKKKQIPAKGGASKALKILPAIEVRNFRLV